MDRADIQYLFGYDRWATTRILDAAVGVDEATWTAPNAIGERGLAGILVHALGAHQRWRHGLSGATGDSPRPEDGPLPSLEALRAAWQTEWPAMDAWLASLPDDDVMAQIGGRRHPTGRRSPTSSTMAPSTAPRRPRS